MLQDINLVNISILVAGLFYFLGPLLGESMASREKAAECSNVPSSPTMASHVLHVHPAKDGKSDVK